MQNKHHEVVDIEHWIKKFPLKDFEKTSGPRRFATSKPDDPIDLWKASGTYIVSPADLAMTEQVRRRVAKKHDLGRAVPTDLFLFGVGEPKLPYLTKIGGVPYRPADRPWPKAKDGTSLTFFLQFCFLDSQDILPQKLPGDVMLMFIRDMNAIYQHGTEREYCIEWSSVPLANHTTVEHCPTTETIVPKYYGAIHRTNEYPESERLFEIEGYYDYWLFATTQATRIGTETNFIQGDVYRDNGETLLCCLSCVFFQYTCTPYEYPFINVKSSSELLREQRNAMEIILGDCGCLYFLLDPQGNIRWEHDCY